MRKANPINELKKLPESVNVVAISKKRSIDDIRKLQNEGYKNFGENRVQELKEKTSALKDLNLIWHFIGNIQSKEVKTIVECSNYVHSITRLKELVLINKNANQIQKTVNVFLQLNCSGEESKSGIQLVGTSEIDGLNELKKLVEFAENAQYINFIGLMTMAPNTTESEVVKSTFNRCYNVGRQLERQMNLPSSSIQYSMGMSNDYKIAISEGTNWIRVGSLLFNNLI